MSYILDALKKIEHEKNRKINSDGRINISGDLFQEPKQPETRVWSWKTVALIVVASLVTCAGTWYLLRGSNKNHPAVVSQAVVPPQPAVIVPVVPPAPVQAPPSVKLAEKRPTVSVTSVTTEHNDDELTADADASASVHGTKSLHKQATTGITLPRQAIQMITAPADIKLSGIAWQDAHDLRRAVINGFLLKEGAVVSGAKITNILVDRVRFTSSAGIFEIKLDAILPAEVQK